MSDIDHAHTLLRMAEIDADALVNMMDAHAFPDEVFGFHAQQAVEKGLKAWTAAIGARYPKTHDIEELIDVLKANAQALHQEALPLVELYPFAVQYRYEAIDAEEEPLDRADVLRRVSTLLQQVGRVLEMQAQGSSEP
jgi:HEPN domain-containing protein